VIRNTRIPVELLLRKLAEGATVEGLLDAYPRLTKDDIQASLAYAAKAISTRRHLQLEFRVALGCDFSR
jgi:uncharacterized protein (DUF433 family)